MESSPLAEATSFGHAWADVAFVLPFAGLLLSIAVVPVLAFHFWERHFGLITAGWTAAFLVPFTALRGIHASAHDLVHALALDFVPFILLIVALFVVSGGIRLHGTLVGDPKTNATILASGTLLASLLGTTGAAMLLIRPLIQANEARRHKTHVMVFFIFLVGNIGGALTPLGDPPLFVGFLRGVDFLWTVQAMWAPMAIASLVLLALFAALDSWFWRKDRDAFAARRSRTGLQVEGRANVVYLVAIVAAVLASGLWRSEVAIPIGFGIAVPLQDAIRDGVLLGVGVLSWQTTPLRVRIENAFTWVPMREVAILFFGIFVTIIPVLAILKAGHAGPAAPLIAAMFGPDGAPNDARFFWLTGFLSSFLDNAPTYLVFFNLAGGDPAVLMTELHRTLLAISMGAVFMGANSYLGNAPNFMIKAICEEQGVRMPSFFGYLLWSGAILLPLFALLSALFF